MAAVADRRADPSNLFCLRCGEHRVFRRRPRSTVSPFWQNGSTVLPVKTLTIKVPDALFAEIASAAETRKVSKSEIVRERLAAQPGFARTKKASVWSRMEDLMIRADSLPTDLSSNKAHLKGYGNPIWRGR
jgi:hypothetical protein